MLTKHQGNVLIATLVLQTMIMIIDLMLQVK